MTQPASTTTRLIFKMQIISQELIKISNGEALQVETPLVISYVPSILWRPEIKASWVKMAIFAPVCHFRYRFRRVPHTHLLLNNVSTSLLSL